MMKTFEVELRRTSFVVITVEAETAEEAEVLAFNEAVDNHAYAAWDVESIEEVLATDESRSNGRQA